MRLSMVCVLVFLSVELPAVCSGQTIYGQGGMFVHPSAFVRPARALNFGASFFTQRAGSTGHAEWNPYSLSYGVSDALEAGITAIRHQGSGIESHSHVGPFVRYEAIRDSPSHPAVGFLLSDLPSDLRQTTLAGVLSHRVAETSLGPILVHGGVEWVRTSGDTGNQTDAAPFVGVQLPVARRLALVGEAGTKLKFERASATAIGLMWSPRGGGSVAIGWVNNGRSRSNEFFVGAGYPIGGAK